MRYELNTLANQLKTVFVESPGSTASSVQIWFRAGSSLETTQYHGIAHFLEHMFFKGTATRPGAEMAKEVESLGGEFNAFTSFDYTCYYINIPDKHIARAADILLDMVSNPTFKQEDLVPERGVVLEEYRRSIDSPQQLAFHQLQKSCFTKAYQHPILGHEKNIKNFSREQLDYFRNSFYNNTNSLFVVAGSIDNKKEIIDTIERYQLPKGEANQFSAFDLKKKTAVTIHQKDVRTAHLYLAIQAPRFKDPLAVNEDLAINCLGHGETARLHKALVVEDCTASSVDASTMFMNDGGIHFLSLSFPYENFSQVAKKLHSTLKASLGNLNEAELEKIKNQYIASKVFEKESLESYAFSLGHNYALTEDLEADQKFLDHIKYANLAEVNRALFTIFNRPIHLSLQIPRSIDKEKAKKDLTQLSKKLETLQKEQSSLPKKKVVVSKQDPSLKTILLKKGVQLLYRQNTASPTFVFQAYLKSGLAQETAKNNGIHHLISRTISKGYDGISNQELKEELENKSIQLGGFAGKNAYGILMHAQSIHQSRAITHAIGTLLRPDFKNKYVLQEKKLLTRSFENQKESPTHHCFEAASNYHFNGHPYSLPTLGTKQSIKNIKRQDLELFHQKNLKGCELLFTYCGSQSLEEVEYLIEKELGSIKPRVQKKKVPKKLKPELGKVQHIPFEREQVHLLVSTQTENFTHKEYIYLKTLTAHLSGQSSELFVEMRDRQGLCYTAQPIHFAALEAGYWGIYMASGQDKAKAALIAINKLINKIKENGLNEDEFLRLKTMIEGQELLSLQTNEDYANSFSIPILHGLGIDYTFKISQRINEMKYEDFQKGIKKVLNRKWNTITVGNYK